jgi:hypothetical protein
VTSPAWTLLSHSLWVYGRNLTHLKNGGFHRILSFSILALAGLSSQGSSTLRIPRTSW